LGRVEIHYRRLAITVHDLALDTSTMAIVVREIEVDWPLASLVRNDARPDIYVRGPEVTLRVERSNDDEPSERPAQLDAFDTLEITGGAVTVRLATHRGPTELSLHDIEATLANPRFGSSQMGTRLAVTATLPGRGTLRADGQISSTDPRLAWRIRFDVQKLELSPFNRLFLDIVEMDVESGTLSVTGELLRTTAHLRGQITPHFEDLVVYTPGEASDHPMGEALFGHMLAGADATIDINRVLDAGSTLSLARMLSTDWKELVADVIKRGYSRRLGTLDGYEAKIGDVEIDFGMGLLTLLDVELVNDSHQVDVPFVSVPRIDVVFDDTVIERDAKAYKHVTLWDPTLVFVAGETGSESQVKFDDRWIDKVSALPFKTRDLVVHGGRVEYRDDRYETPVRFFVSDIEMVGLEMAEGLHPTGFRGGRLSGSGRIMGAGVTTFAVAFEPRASVPNIDLDIYLAPLALSTLNPVLLAYAEVEADGGSLGFSAHISARRLHVDASVVPTVVAPKLRSVAGARHRLRHVRLERRI
ncbi:MAG: DUF748 domain-containing protein, partial [Nannocystaceae bacterium]|nr:DUF748 domain-containing protein [Nannocystaceae bacterium]